MSGQLPPVRVRVWVRVTIRVGRLFSSVAVVLDPLGVPLKCPYLSP